MRRDERTARASSRACVARSLHGVTFRISTANLCTFDPTTSAVSSISTTSGRRSAAEPPDGVALPVANRLNLLVSREMEGAVLRICAVSIRLTSVCVGLACGVIQPAIDAAPNGAIIVLHRARYQENVNLWKPVTLQGFGAAVTLLDGTAALGNLALKQQAVQPAAEPHRHRSDRPRPRPGLGLHPRAGGRNPRGRVRSRRGLTVGPTQLPARAAAQIDGLTITGATEAGGGDPRERLRGRPQDHQQRDPRQPGEHRRRHPHR